MAELTVEFADAEPSESFQKAVGKVIAELRDEQAIVIVKTQLGTEAPVDNGNAESRAFAPAAIASCVVKAAADVKAAVASMLSIIGGLASNHPSIRVKFSANGKEFECEVKDLKGPTEPTLELIFAYWSKVS